MQGGCDCAGAGPEVGVGQLQPATERGLHSNCHRGRMHGSDRLRHQRDLPGRFPSSSKHDVRVVRVGQKLQLGHSGGGVGREDADVLVQQAFGGLVPEAVGQGDLDGVAGLDHQGDRVVRCLDHVHAGDAQATFGGRRRGRIVLDHHERVEQFGQPGPALDPGERRLLVLDHLPLVRGEPAQHVSHALVTTAPNPRRHGVDQQPRDVIDTGQLDAATRNRRAENHIVAPGHPADQHPPRGRDHVADRHAITLGNLANRSPVDRCPDPACSARNAPRSGREQRRLDHPIEQAGERFHVPLTARREEVPVGEGRRERLPRVQGEQFIQDQRHRPAVRDDVMHGLDQYVAVIADPHERVPHARRRGQVERLGTLGRGHRFHVSADHVPPRSRNRAAEHRHDLATGRRTERRSQVGAPVEHGGRRAVQAFGVEAALEVDELLHDVRVGARIVRCVEVETGLQRGERKDVAHLPTQRVHLGLGELHEREVAGGVPGHGRVGGQLAQVRGPAVGDRLHLGAGQHRAGPAEHSRQLGARGDRVDLKGARQRHAGVTAFDDHLTVVEAAQVVEQHAGLDGEIVVAREIAQDAVRDPVARHRPQLILDRLDRRSRSEPGNVKRDREQRGEPADRTRKVKVHGVFLAPVSLQFQQERLVRRDRQRQRGHQRIVHAAVNGRRYGTEQPVRDVLGQRDGQRFLGRDRARADRQRSRGNLRSGLPERQVSTEVHAPQRRRPLPERGRGGRDRQAGAQGLGEHPQRDAVDDRVVQRDDQLATVGEVRERDHALGAQPGYGGLQVLALAQHLGRRDRTGRAEGQRGPLDRPAQHVVRGEQAVDEVGTAVEGHSDRLEEAVETVADFVQPGQDRRGRHLTDSLDRGLLRFGGQRHDQRQRGRGGVGEQVTGAQRETGAPGGSYGTDGHDAVAAEREEVVLGADCFQPEHVLEHVAQARFGFRTRRAGTGRAEHRDRQCPPVDLAVGGQRERLKDHENRGHHVLGKPLGTPVAQVVGGCGGAQDGVPDQVSVLDCHHGLADRRVGRGDGLDLLQLQAHAADLHLVVGAPGELQAAITGPAGQVPGAVHAGAAAEGVGDEPGGGQRGSVDVTAAEQETGGIEFPGHARPDRVEIVVEHVQLGVRVGTPDRGGDALG